ncbi:bifunctional (p)ppGpp synthetase/guanosine-3',5'-bis(diphosphate) 3'-pyrophosphohydrolase [Candidatus Peregrinibacteria bacterium]|nr:bifunctional (p)ppGpp synthetase/guanosine-3',5'-bis(diphosphate) 3'-pyrophosphohydrolase [Candidatus Peregrinibacteria bacterium]
MFSHFFPTTAQFRQKLLRQWFRFLVTVNNEPSNRELALQYFFERCAQAPEMFHAFLEFFKKKLQRSRNAEAKHLAEKYLHILSTLCERFSFFEEKQILDDRCFAITHPKKYREIDQLLGRYKKQSKKLINHILQTLTLILREKNHLCDIKGRYKNIYSIARKLQKKPRKTALTLNDIFAFRIIPRRNSIKPCFEILNLLHDTFYPDADYFKDYITIPKINGYQSLHTGLYNVVPELDLPIEVQIRTKPMDDFSEHGLASHWLYAQGKKSKLITEKEKKLLNYFSSIGQTPEASNFIYGFSYKGDIVKLEKGSTILDFAYLIHTDLGNKTRGALVNDTKKTFNYEIQEGDVVQILKDAKPQVSPAWMAAIHTKHARKKISEYLKKHASKT